MRQRERVASIVAFVIALSVVGAMLWRVRRGIDYTDEAFYLAVPYRFVLGDRPFVDELNIAQTAGLLAYPLVKAFVAIRGTTGLFLFMRCAFVAFFALIGVATYRLAATRLPRHVAVLTAAAMVAFIPYGLPNLSYNTFGCGLFALGLVLVARAIVAGSPKAFSALYQEPLAWGGFALAAAAFAYPSVAVGAVVATGSTFLVARGARLASSLRVVAGAVAFVVVLAPLVLWSGPRHVQDMMTYTAGAVSVTGDRLPALWDAFVNGHPEIAKLALALAVCIAVSRRWPRVAAVLVLALPLAARGSTLAGVTASLGYVASLALVAPLVATVVRDARFALTSLLVLWLPAVLAGVAVAWSSSNGATAAGLGLFPAAICSVLLLARWGTELARSFASRDVRLALGFGPAVVAHAMVTLVVADDAVYRDARVSELTAKITEGPYKGILTTPARKASLARASHELKALATSSRALFYYDFPAGYLITGQRPLVASAWIFAMEPRMRIDSEFFERRASSGDMVFRAEPGFNPGANRLDRAVKDRSDSLGTHEGFGVWRVR